MNSNTKSILNHTTIEYIIKHNFGNDLTISYIKELTDGWFNAVYIISFEEAIDIPAMSNCKEVVLKTGVQTGKYIITYEKDIMKTELNLYDKLLGTEIPVPKILARDLTKSIVDFEYFIMERLMVDNWMNFEDILSEENHNSLVGEMAYFVGKLHQIKGDYFGYIKEDESFHYDNWRTAFYEMVHMMIRDGKSDNVVLPYDDILDGFAPVWHLLEEIKEPRLVNFDLWTKNVMLGYKNNKFFISGLIDHERSFYGDPCGDFNAMNEICGDVGTNPIFIENYSKGLGEEFVYTKNDRIRLCMYKIYLSLLMGVEVYRYEEQDRIDMLDYCHKEIAKDLKELKELIS